MVISEAKVTATSRSLYSCLIPKFRARPRRPTTARMGILPSACHLLTQWSWESLLTSLILLFPPQEGIVEIPIPEN